jgi:hypothetical protein
MGKEVMKTEENEKFVGSFGSIINIALEKDISAGYKPINRISPDTGTHSHFITHATMLAAVLNSSEECLRTAIKGAEDYNRYVDGITINLKPVTNLAYLFKQVNDTSIFITSASINEIYLDYLLFKKDPLFEKSLVSKTIIPDTISLLNNCWNDNGELCVSQSCFKDIASIICFQFLLIIVEDLDRNELISLVDHNSTIKNNIDGVIRLARKEVNDQNHSARTVVELRAGIESNTIKLAPSDAKWSMENLIDTRNGGFETKIRKASKILSTL